MCSNLLCGLIPPKREPVTQATVEKPPLPTRQFGTSLKDIKKHYKVPIPPVLETCIKYLKVPEVIITPNLFKTTVPPDIITKLEDAADHNKDLIFTSPHEVATLIKVFLRHLPEPLFSPVVYKKIVEFHKVEKHMQMHLMHELIRCCPNDNIRVIRALAHLLHEVAENSDKNGMDAEMLSKMFGQGMFIRNVNGIVPVADIIHVNFFIEYMITNCNGIFT